MRNIKAFIAFHQIINNKFRYYNKEETKKPKFFIKLIKKADNKY